MVWYGSRRRGDVMGVTNRGGAGSGGGGGGGPAFGWYEWRGDLNTDIPPPIPTGFTFTFDGAAGTSIDYSPYDSGGIPITVPDGISATIAFDPVGDIPAAHADFSVTSFADLSSGDTGFRLVADGANAPYTGMTIYLTAINYITLLPLNGWGEITITAF